MGYESDLCIMEESDFYSQRDLRGELLLCKWLLDLKVSGKDTVKGLQEEIRMLEGMLMEKGVEADSGAFKHLDI
jgi:hypothetical protein